MACIFNTVLLDISAAMTDLFEGRGAYSRRGAYWRIYGRLVAICRKVGQRSFSI